MIVVLRLELIFDIVVIDYEVTCSIKASQSITIKNDFWFAGNLFS